MRGQPQENAVLVWRLSVLLQCPHRHPDAEFQDSDAQVGDWNLPVHHIPEIGFFDEAAPRSQDQAGVRVVHASAHPRGVDG